MPNVNVAVIENVVALRASEKALLCEVDGKQVWIPQSQILDDSEVWKAADEGQLVIPMWLAEEKGLV